MLDVKTTLKHYFYTTKHKIYVLYYLVRFCLCVLWRGLVHDISKYSNIETYHYSRVSKRNLKNVTYGSTEYNELLQIIKPALDHHYSNNRHHPEYHPKGINDMTLVDVVEMFFDWYASTKKHNDGNIYRSIDINSKRFNMPPQLCDIFRNSVPKK